MSLHGLLLIMSVALAEDAGYELCYEDFCNSDYENDTINENYDEIVTPLMGNEIHHGPYDFISSDISCIISKLNHLSCSWNSSTLPKDAEYSAFCHLCTEESSYHSTHQLNCSSNTKKERVECQGQISSMNFVIVHVNISILNHSYMICKKYEAAQIEKLDPPEMSVLQKSKDLYINWLLPKSTHTTKKECFEYELKINNETVSLQLSDKYIRENIDLTRNYTVQIRTRVKLHCLSEGQWSDWSKMKVMSPSEKKKFNVGVIVSIAFVLPMILLAFLLVCKFQRLAEKLFPSIPSPSVKILEKDDFSQFIPPKHDDSRPEAEEGKEIFQVTS